MLPALSRPGWVWDWVANSLNPMYLGNDTAQMIEDDALIRATEEHWCFGQDGSGDICKQ